MFHCHIFWWLLCIGFLKLLFRYSQSMRVGKHYEQRHFVEFRIEHPVLGNCDGVHVTFKLKKYCGTLTVTMYCSTWAELSCPTVFFCGDIVIRGMWRHSLSSKIRLMCSLVTSIFLYACESWTLTAELQRSIQLQVQAMEMR